MICFKNFVLWVSLLVVVSVTTVKGQKDNLTIVQIAKKLPSKLLYDLNESALDSLLKFGKFIDPEGDSLVTVAYEFRSINNQTAHFSSYFLTGQRGFKTIELKSFISKKGEQFVIHSNHSGSGRMFDQNELKCLEYIDSKILECDLKGLPIRIDSYDFYKSHFPDSLKEVISTGYDLDTKNKNTLEYYSFTAGSIDDSNIFKKFIYKWNGLNFEKIGK